MKHTHIFGKHVPEIIVQFERPSYKEADATAIKLEKWEQKHRVGLQNIEVGASISGGICVGLLIADINWQSIVGDLLSAGFGIPKCYEIS